MPKRKKARSFFEQNRRNLIIIGLTVFLISFIINIFSIFLEHPIFNIFKIIFVALIAILALLIGYRALQKQKIERRSPIIGFITNKIDITFQALVIIYLILLITNEFWEITFFELHYLLYVTGIMGIISTILPSRKKRGRWNKFMEYFIAAAGSIFLTVKTKQLGFLSYIVGIVTFMLIITLTYLIVEEED